MYYYRRIDNDIGDDIIFMMSSQRIEDTQDVMDMSFLSSLYTVVRIVHPFSKEVIVDYSRKKFPLFNGRCICSQEKEYPCKRDGCMAEKAYMEGKGFHKLVQYHHKLWLVAVIPLLYKAKPSVLELVKDVTNALTIEEDEYRETVLFQQFFMQMNDTIVKDKLTGLYNKKYLYSRLDRDIREAAANQQTVSLLFIDLDKFKLINDDCGHMEGDQVLADVAKIFCNTIRIKEDWACRFGGDEFIVCLNNVKEASAYQIAERIRIKIFQLRQDKDPGISTSIGIYTVNMKNATENMSIEEILCLADKQMYLAKKQGGNCTAMNGVIQ